MTDESAFCLTIWGEARGEPIEGKIGVACVIRNRVVAHYRGAVTYAQVCQAHEQFSAWSDEAVAMAAEQKALAGGAPDATLLLCREIAKAIMANLIPDITRGANHYYATTIAPPSWAVGQPLLVALGRQRFYNVA